MQRSVAGVFVVLAVVVAIGARTTLNGQSRGPWIGTWKVNVQKSTYSPGPKPKVPVILKLEQSPGGLKITHDGMNSEGQQYHTEIVGTFDGKDNPVKGELVPNTTAALNRIDDHTFEALFKTDGKLMTTRRVSVSADGKSLTITIVGKNLKGEAVNNIIIAERQ